MSLPAGNHHQLLAPAFDYQRYCSSVVRQWIMLTVVGLSLAGVLWHGRAIARDTPTQDLAITVREAAGIAGQRPVTGGVPFPIAAVPKGSEFLLLDEAGKPAPCQTSVLARWKDGSARWVLLDFQASPSAEGLSKYVLRGNVKSNKVAPPAPVKVIDRAKGILQTGAIRLGPADDAVVSIGERLDIRLSLIDDQGQRGRGIVESRAIEAEGPLRGTILLRGAFRRPDGSRALGFRLRASLFAGLPRVFLEPHLLVDADSGVVQQIRGLVAGHRSAGRPQRSTLR